MAKLKTFMVARAHLGDRITDGGIVPHQFEEGEERLADPVVVAALVRNGVLVDPDDAEDAGAPGKEPVMTEAKAEEAPLEDKAEEVPANKAEPDKPAKNSTK